jgi:hypothetical protein
METVGKTPRRFRYRFRQKIPKNDSVFEKYRYRWIRSKNFEISFRNSEKFRNRFHPYAHWHVVWRVVVQSGTCHEIDEYDSWGLPKIYHEVDGSIYWILQYIASDCSWETESGDLLVVMRVGMKTDGKISLVSVSVFYHRKRDRIQNSRERKWERDKRNCENQRKQKY